MPNEADPSLPTIVTAGDCGSPKPSGGQGRHVILNLVHSSSSGKPITKDWPLPPLVRDGVQPERPVPLRRQRWRQRKPHSLLQRESLLQVGFLPFS